MKNGYMVKVTGWAHGKATKAYLGNAKVFPTREDADTAAAGALAVLHGLHPRTVARYTTEVCPAMVVSLPVRR